MSKGYRAISGYMRSGSRKITFVSLLLVPAFVSGCALEKVLQHRGDPVIQAGVLSSGTDGHGNGTGYFCAVGVGEEPGGSPQWDVLIQYNAVDLGADKLSRVVYANYLYWSSRGRAFGPMIHGGLSFTWTSWGDRALGPLCGFGLFARAGHLQIQAFGGLSLWIGKVDDSFGVSSSADAYLSMSYYF